LRHKQILAKSLAAAVQALQGVDELDVIGYSFTAEGGQLVDHHLDFVFRGRHLVVISSTAAKSKQICANLRSIGYDAVAHEACGFEDYAGALR
jgi:rhodanese-related sulfurtransferase